MYDKRIYFTISIPADFSQRFINTLININSINSDKYPPIRIEKIHGEGDLENEDG
jgi:hypothetical protein